MSVSYNNLWKMLIDKKISKGELRKSTGISTGTMAKMRNDEPVTLTIIEKICKELKCNIEDVVEIVPDSIDIRSQNNKCQEGQDDN